MRNAVVLEKVSKTFATAGRAALESTSLAIPHGRFVTVLGSSGSGKTTLLKLINRLYEPSTGRVLVNGVDVTAQPPHLLRRGIGYVIQQGGLFEHMNVERNVGTVPRILGWDKAAISARVEELLELVGLAPREFRGRYPRQLSGGQQQRVGLARALAARPSIVLMDEPFGAVDPLTRARLQDEVLAIQRELGLTVVLVTHDVGEALKLGDEVIVMHDGRVQQHSTPRRIVREPANDFVRAFVESMWTCVDWKEDPCGATYGRILAT